MKIFVTGASGYIGHAVAAAHARAGHDVIGLVRTERKGAALAAEEIRPLVGAMGDLTAMAPAIDDCDVVIHCAADYAGDFMRVDRDATTALIEIARKSRRPRTFVYTSGVWVYGDTGTSVVNEGSKLNPLQITAPRADTERLVLEAAGGALRTVVIRPGCVYGGRGGLTGLWFDGALKNGRPTAIGAGLNRWAMVHVEDLGDLYLRAVESQASGEVFNGTDRSRFTVAECAAAAAAALGIVDRELLSVPLDAALVELGSFAHGTVLSQHVDSSKAVRVLGWQPRHGGFVDGADRYALAWKCAREEHETGKR